MKKDRHWNPLNSENIREQKRNKGKTSAVVEQNQLNWVELKNRLASGGGWFLEKAIKGRKSNQIPDLNKSVSQNNSFHESGTNFQKSDFPRICSNKKAFGSRKCCHSTGIYRDHYNGFLITSTCFNIDGKVENRKWTSNVRYFWDSDSDSNSESSLLQLSKTTRLYTDSDFDCINSLKMK